LTKLYENGISKIMELNVRKIEIELNRLGWSKYRLAQEMGVKRQWVYVVLKRKGGNTLSTVSKIANALGVDPKELLT
jgi:plasmid maintenance system antidote protein VapI